MKDSSEVASNPQAELKSAQSELAALREENERLKSESFEELYNAAIDERDALREELATMKREFEVGQQNWVDGMKSLTAAEQRNAELVGLLRRVLDTDERSKEFWVVVKDIDAAINPTESGASDAERKEDDRWLQMKDDQERADYFDGSGASE